MNYVVLDLEWNMPERRTMIIRNPFTFNGEIVQVGAVKLNEKMEEVDQFNLIIKPVFYPKMSRDITKLTGITDEMISEGEAFSKGIEEFKKWCEDDCIWLTWGPDDIYMIEDNLEIHEMDKDWLPVCLDAQLMFDDLEMMEDRQFALDYAVYHFKIKGNTGHDALNDAIDTAAVIKKMEGAADWISEELDYYSK